MLESLVLNPTTLVIKSGCIRACNSLPKSDLFSESVFVAKGNPYRIVWNYWKFWRSAVHLGRRNKLCRCLSIAEALAATSSKWDTTLWCPFCEARYNAVAPPFFCWLINWESSIKTFAQPERTNLFGWESCLNKFSSRTLAVEWEPQYCRWFYYHR